ncbi:MAG: DUF2849 domain-containing protein [Alphaproteobacteria bacterium]|nr:DUF2849 domain-containing protein [Alphaproteobacteria bacterium]
MSAEVISANRLRDGLVVYLTAEGNWSESIADAEVAHGEEEAAALLARAQADVEKRLVVDPYLINVDIGDGAPRPTRFRELIRAKGPTVRRDLGKQAGA